MFLLKVSEEKKKNFSFQKDYGIVQMSFAPLLEEGPFSFTADFKPSFVVPKYISFTETCKILLISRCVKRFFFLLDLVLSMLRWVFVVCLLGPLFVRGQTAPCVSGSFLIPLSFSLPHSHKTSL